MPIAISGATTPAGLVKTGTIAPWTTASAPNEWLLCDGSAVSRTTYAALFAVIGTTYGAGDGSTTFNVPDLRRRTIHGYKAADSDFGTLGNAAGNASHTIAQAELPAVGVTFDSSNSAGGGTTRITRTDGASNGTFTTNALGSGTAINTLTPYITLNWVIKY